MKWVIFLVTICALINVNYGDDDSDAFVDIGVYAVNLDADNTDADDNDDDDNAVSDNDDDNREDDDDNGDSGDDDDDNGDEDYAVDGNIENDDYDASAELQLKDQALDEKEIKSIAEKMIAAYESEMKAGNAAELLPTNRHYYIPGYYKDFSRRFVLQYPYKEVEPIRKTKDVEIIPVKAPPELVIALAKESLRLEKFKPVKQIEEKDILRTGEYWNAVWKEDVNPKDLLRSQDKSKKRNLNTINANILPGSSIYELIVKLKDISPQLLYIINKKQK